MHIVLLELKQVLVHEWQNIPQAFLLVLCAQWEGGARLVLMPITATCDTHFVSGCNQMDTLTHPA